MSISTEQPRSASTSVAVAPGPGYLIDVTDSFGRNIAYTYNAAGLVNHAKGESKIVGLEVRLDVGNHVRVSEEIDHSIFG